jgi:hypothetical protein
MSLGSQIQAGRAYVELLLKDESFKAGLKRISTSMAAWGRGLRAVGAGIFGAGAAIVAPFAAAVPLFAKSAARISDQSGRLGAPVEDLQRLAYAADHSGTSLEEIIPSLMFFQKELAKSGKSGADLVANLKSIANELQKIEDPAKRIEFMAERFGKAGAALIPMLSGGAAGMEGLFGHADGMGMIMKAEDIEAAAKLDDTFTELVNTLQSLGNVLAASVIPYVQPIAEIVISVVSATVQWIDQHRTLAVVLAATGVALMVVGGALIALGLTFTVIATAVSGFAAALAFVSGPVGVIVVAIGGIIVGLGILAATIISVTGQWENLWAALEGYASYTISALRAVLDFMLAGDWKNAGKTMALAIAAGLAEVPGVAELFNIAGLGDIKKQLDAAIKQAEAMRKEREAKNPPKPQPGLPDLGDAFGSANQLVRPALGFMNAGQAHLFGTESVKGLQQRIARNTELMVEELRQMGRKVGPVRFR